MGRIIKSPPLLRIKYGNLIKNYADAAAGEGLLGTCGGFSYAPNRDAGFWVKDGNIYAKVFSINLDFQPLHEDTVGFDEKGNFLMSEFPRGLESGDPRAGIAVASAASATSGDDQ